MYVCIYMYICMCVYIYVRVYTCTDCDVRRAIGVSMHSMLHGIP